MKCAISKVEVESTFTLSRRELELLHHIFSYSNDKYVESLETKAYCGATKKELVEFLDGIRNITSSLMSRNQQIEVFRK